MSKPTVRAAFAAVTTLFFAWGFITSLIDPLVAAVKGIFTLSDVQAQLSARACISPPPSSKCMTLSPTRVRES